MIPSSDSTSQVLLDSKQWLERAVIGLNLCPFAKSVHVKSLIRYAISDAKSESELLADLQSELIYLNSVSPTITDTTLLIAPMCLHDFLEFNQFAHKANKLLTKLDLEGIFQIATCTRNINLPVLKLTISPISLTAHPTLLCIY